MIAFKQSLELIADVPTLSQISKIKFQFSVVLDSLVAFSAKAKDQYTISSILITYKDGAITKVAVELG